MTSDAPIAVAPGLSRSAMRLYGRSVTGGLAATLYYQQENAVSGYPGTQPAPLKQAARVMLAAVTGATPHGRRRTRPSRPTVVAVDFGVGVDGTLAQLPGEVALTELDVPGGGPGTGADVLANVFSAQADVADLTQDLADDSRGHRRAAAQDAVARALAGAVSDAGQPCSTPTPPSHRLPGVRELQAATLQSRRGAGSIGSRCSR